MLGVGFTEAYVKPAALKPPLTFAFCISEACAVAGPVLASCGLVVVGSLSFVVVLSACVPVGRGEPVLMLIFGSPDTLAAHFCGSRFS